MPYRKSWTFEQQRNFAQRVLDFRAQHHLTQEALAVVINRSVRTIRNMERRQFAPFPNTLRGFATLERKYREGREIETALQGMDWLAERRSVREDPFVAPRADG